MAETAPRLAATLALLAPNEDIAQRVLALAADDTPALHLEACADPGATANDACAGT